MKPNVLAFGASTSSTSINAAFAQWAAGQLDAEINFQDLNNFELPLFSVDLEKEVGQPDAAKRFKQHILDADGVIISLAEHNGSFAAAYKNLVDWASRIERDLFANKPMLLLATSPGRGGGGRVLAHAASIYPTMAANVVAQFSLPSYNHTFDNGITDPEKQAEFETALSAFAQAIAK